MTTAEVHSVETLKYRFSVTLTLDDEVFEITHINNWWSQSLHCNDTEVSRGGGWLSLETEFGFPLATSQGAHTVFLLLTGTIWTGFKALTLLVDDETVLADFDLRTAHLPVRHNEDAEIFVEAALIESSVVKQEFSVEISCGPHMATLSCLDNALLVDDVIVSPAVSFWSPPAEHHRFDLRIGPHVVPCEVDLPRGHRWSGAEAINLVVDGNTVLRCGL